MTCSHEQCAKPTAARGLCKTHYNQTRPNRHRTITVKCDGCGAEVKRDASVKRWSRTHCGELCRRWNMYGSAPSSELPASHWARWYGATSQWLPRGWTLRCEWCDAEHRTHQPFTRFCGSECSRRAAKARRRALEHGAPGTYRWADLVRLWVAFDRCCAYCRQPTPLDEIQAEHVHPLSKGGRNDLSNLLPACGQCNADKRDLLLLEWKTDRERRQLPAVTTAWSPEDVRYTHLRIPTVSLAAA